MLHVNHVVILTNCRRESSNRIRRNMWIFGSFADALLESSLTVRLPQPTAAGYNAVLPPQWLFINLTATCDSVWGGGSVGGRRAHG